MAWLGFVCALCAITCSAVAQETIKIWEFAPYEVEVWCALDAGLDVSELAKTQFTKSLSNQLEQLFQATWRTQITPADAELHCRLARGVNSLKLDDLTREELVLIVNRDPTLTSTVRTFETAVEKINEISILPADKLKLDVAAAKSTLVAEPSVAGLLQKLKVIEGGLSALMTGLEAKTIQAALLPRSAFTKPVEQLARQVSMLLPWQTDNLLRQRDKIFMLFVGRDSDGYYVKARELDCGLQFMGPTVYREATSWNYLSRVAGSAIAAAFAPVARVESATAKAAELRLKSGGLVLEDDNPCLVKAGDLMHPIVRRDDRNGVPNLLEPLPWTYAAITDSDGIKMNANVYAYSGGPGLQGRNNRRTQRFLLRVRPQQAETEILVTVRGTGKPQGGCAVYERDIETEKFTFLGNTDWRGRFTLTRPSKYGVILPDALRVAKDAAEKAAKAAAELAAASAVAVTPNPDLETDENAQSDQGSSRAKSNDATVAAAPTASPPAALVPFDTAGKTVALRQPLVQLYIKSGDVVLARLPVVPGNSPLEIADLADDSRRLEAEAFMRGFQGEILDLIGLRTLLSTRIKRLIQQSKMSEAEKILIELRSLKDYSAMVETLDKLQRKVLDESAGPISLGAKSRIDRLFQSTREMMQKFLQNDLVRDAETAFSNGPQPEVVSTADSAAAETK